MTSKYQEVAQGQWLKQSKQLSWHISLFKTQQWAEVCCCLNSFPLCSACPGPHPPAATQLKQRRFHWTSEVSIKAEPSNRENSNPTLNHIVLLCRSLQVPAFKHRSSCGHSPNSDVTVGILPITADGKHLLRHRWLEPEVSLDVSEISSAAVLSLQ